MTKTTVHQESHTIFNVDSFRGNEVNIYQELRQGLTKVKLQEYEELPAPDFAGSLLSGPLSSHPALLVGGYHAFDKSALLRHLAYKIAKAGSLAICEWHPGDQSESLFQALRCGDNRPTPAQACTP